MERQLHPQGKRRRRVVNDRKFTDRLDKIFKDHANSTIAVVRTGVRMPLMNSICESFIGHAQSECLDHFVCFSLDQLDHIVAAFGNYHNHFRPHQGKDIGNRILDPDWKPPPSVGIVKRQKYSGGLLNHYYRDVA